MEHGVTDGSFRVADPRAAAWFVLGGLQSVELAGKPHDELPEAIDAAIDLALAALGASDDGCRPRASRGSCAR